MSVPNSSSSPSTPLATRGMWLIALLLSIGALSLATSALPGRAKPLFLLPIAFGVASAGLSVTLRRSLSLSCTISLWLITAALALGGYGQVVAASFRQFQAASAASSQTDQESIIAIQMLEGTENRELAGQMQADLDARQLIWDRYMTRRYNALGTLSPRMAGLALAAEALLVIVGVALGRRLLDARKPACHAAGSGQDNGDGSQSS